MKRILIIVVMTIFNLSGLDYVESSNGLIPPTLDGGRTEVEFCDLDEDGNIDMVSIGDHGNPYINTDQHGIIVWFGDGSGNWSNYMNGEFGYGGIAVGDVNNDGDWDVGYGMHHNYSGTDFGDQVMEVALGDGTGRNWIPWDDNLGTHGQDWGMFGTDFADVDNDGDLDVGSVSFGADNGVHVYLNEMDGTWTRSFGFIGGNSRMIFIFTDFNCDGYADFSVTHQYGTVYIGDGTGNFTVGDGNLPPPGTLGHRGVAVGDVNNDGCADISFSNSNGGVEVWIYKSVSVWEDFSGGLPSSGGYEATQLYDMNVDGDLDVVAFGDSVVTLWVGNGNGNWVQEAEFYTPSPGDFEAFRVGGDCDHNGYPDIVLVCDEGSWPNYRNHIHFYKETSTPGQLSIKAIFPHGGEKFYGGSIDFIDWITAVPSGTGTVDLALSTDGPDGPWTDIANSLTDNGRYQWQIPQVSSDNCYIRYIINVGGGADTAMSWNSFEIIAEQNIAEEIEYQTGFTLLPNPAHDKIYIEYVLEKKSYVEIDAYDISGRLVRQILQGIQGPGRYRTLWQAADPGIYYIIIRNDNEYRVEKVVVY